ncbi:MAG: TatD family hydrolase [Alistipes sp.]|nr:TatD family hydrolase [Alistipes sp.]
MLIDTHSHLYDDAFDSDRTEAVQRAVSSGVEKIILPAIDSKSHEGLLVMCDQFPDICYPLMGLHPTSVNDNPFWREEIEIVERHIHNSASGEGMKIYGVGEVGIDLYWSRDFAAQQLEAFRAQIDFSIKYCLPLVIHTREAWPEMRSVISSYDSGKLKGILHSFSGTLDDYRFFCTAGDFLFGIGGPLTYKNSALAEILPFMDIDKIVLETDSPYLPPVPYRGKRNESSYLKNIGIKVAELTGRPVEEIESITTANAIRMFAIEEGK